MYSNQYMRVNTTVTANSFIPVPIGMVGNEFDGLYNDVNLMNARDFTDLNSPKRLNYSSFEQHDGQNNLWNDTSSTMQNLTLQAFKTAGTANEYENPFRMTRDILQEFNNYNKPLTYAMTSVLDLWGEDENNSNTNTSSGNNGGTSSYKSAHSMFIHNVVVRSLFNPYLAINVRGMQSNVPLTNDKYAHAAYDASDYVVDLKSGNVELGTGPSVTALLNDISYSTVKADRYKNKMEFDTSDCTIKTLVKLSKEEKNPNSGGHKYSKLGRSIYKYADFMFCKDLGKVSNNYLITLRKFPLPIGDNIFTLFGNEGNDGDLNIPPDIGRMVCWLGDDNKLEDILKYTVEDSFKEFESDFYEAESKEGDQQRGVIGTITNLMNPQYRGGVISGAWGSENSVLQLIGGATSFSNGKSLLSPSGTYEGDADAQAILFGKRWDENKIYYPKGIIRDTHQYEGRLKFSHEFQLTFNYELRAYDNINPKSAFLDLIGNILKVTYRTGTFWGGEQRVYGIPANKAGWKKATEMINKGINMSEQGVYDFLSGNIDLNSIMGALGDKLKGMWNSLQNVDWSSWKKGAIKTVTGRDEDGNKVNNTSAWDVLGGMFKNFAGRPAMYALKSILSGDPVGLWHVTIGNPRNPIASMGNMIVSNATIQQYGPLGIDDFPTGIKVVVNLKHGRMRDATEIANMYTMGIGAIHIVPKAGLPSMYYDSDEIFRTFGTSDPDMVFKGFSN